MSISNYFKALFLLSVFTFCIPLASVYAGIVSGPSSTGNNTANGPTSISGAGFVTSEATNQFTAGTYTLSESSGPSGYSASAWSCTGDVTNVDNLITLGIGQNSTCTIINNDN